MDEGAVRRILCEILGVSENATDEEIHKGYSEQAKKWHPDRVQHNPELAAIAERKIKEINQAFDCLKSRSEFDKHGAKLARKTQSGLQSQVNPNKSAPPTAKKAGPANREPADTGPTRSDSAKSGSAHSGPAKSGSGDSFQSGSGRASGAADKSSGTANSNNFAQTSQSWHANFTSSGQAQTPAKPVDIPELRKLGTKIALWMTLIFLILAFVEDKMHNHEHLNGFQPQPGITLSGPDNPASPWPATSQPISRPQAPANDSVAPPPGETYPQSIYERNQSN